MSFLGAASSIPGDGPFFQQLTFAGMTGFFIYWVCTSLSKKVDNLSEKIEQLSETIRLNQAKR